MSKLTDTMESAPCSLTELLGTFLGSFLLRYATVSTLLAQCPLNRRPEALTRYFQNLKYTFKNQVVFSLSS